MLSAIVTSDWHLDAYYHSSSLRHAFTDRGDVVFQVKEIEKPFDYALENTIEHVFILGDIGDRHILTEDSRNAVLTTLLKYDGLLNIHIITGNHDVSTIDTNSLSILRILDQHNRFKSIRVYDKTEQIVVDGVTCNMVPFPFTESGFTDEKAVNFCHLETRTGKMNNGMSTKKWDIDFSERGGFWVSGHLHRHQTGKNYVYCGAPYQLNFGSSLPCGFIHIKVRSDPFAFKHKFINQRPAISLKNVHIEQRSDWSLVTKDPSILYKVSVADDMVVPTDIRTRFPNIVKIAGKELKINEFNESQDIPVIEVDTGLDDFLRSRELSDEQVERGISIVQQALTQI